MAWLLLWIAVALITRTTVAFVRSIGVLAFSIARKLSWPSTLIYIWKKCQVLTVSTIHAYIDEDEPAGF